MVLCRKEWGSKQQKTHKALINLVITLNTQRLVSDEYYIMCLISAQQSKIMFSFGQNWWKILIKWKLPFSLTIHFAGKCPLNPCNILPDSPIRQILCLCMTQRECLSARFLQFFAITAQLWLICQLKPGVPILVVNRVNWSVTHFTHATDQFLYDSSFSSTTYAELHLTRWWKVSFTITVTSAVQSPVCTLIYGWMDLHMANIHTAL